MKRKLSILLLITISFSCYSQININIEFSETEKDSISNIISKLYGNWISKDKEMLKLYENGTYNCYMTIDECLILGETKSEVENMDIDIFENRICIEEIIPISETLINSSEPSFVDIALLIKKHYLQDSFGIYIAKKDNSYGFLYPVDMDNTFLPIEFLNDNLLILMDGREFKKIN